MGFDVLWAPKDGPASFPCVDCGLLTGKLQKHHPTLKCIMGTLSVAILLERHSFFCLVTETAAEKEEIE